MAGNTLGQKLGVTSAQIKKIQKLEAELTEKAMAALRGRNTATFQKLIEERDCQTAWLRAYAY